VTDRSPEARPPEYGILPPRYRLPETTRVGRVRLQVGDLGRSRDWYTRILGFRALEGEGARVVLGAEEHATPLIELHERPGAAPAPRGGRPGLYHFAILLPDRPALGRFAAHLASLGARAGASDHRVSEALYLQDPDGLGIEVYADRPRSEWRHEGRQVVMATDPLDLASVIRSAEGQGWTGMPGGTVIGHVHLHVGDLGRAEAFYHAGLGLDKTVWSYPGALFLSAGGYHHHLGLNTWAAEASPAGEDDARLLDWEILVPSPEDARAAFESLRTDGHEVEESDGLARDPWGTTVRIRGTDSHQVPGHVG
jgi:catechol 2,3-dioxygenase